MEELEYQRRALVCVEESKVEGLGADKEFTALSKDTDLLRDRLKEGAGEFKVQADRSEVCVSIFSCPSRRYSRVVT